MKRVKIGEFLTPDAIKLAQNRGLDLIEVAPNARPPGKLELGRIMYEKKKKEQATKKKSKYNQSQRVKLTSKNRRARLYCTP